MQRFKQIIRYSLKMVRLSNSIQTESHNHSNSTTQKQNSAIFQKP